VGLVVEELEELGVIRLSRWVFNCYVIRTLDGGAVVVDAGLPQTPDDVAPYLERLDGPIHAIVATHGHSDHVAGAAELARRCEAPILLPAKTITYLDGPQPRTPTTAAVARIWPTLLDQSLDGRAVSGLISGSRTAGYGTPAGMRWSGPPPAGGLSDDQQIPGAPAWTVIAVPGHTDDSVAFWNPETRVLLSGDAVLSARGRAWHTPETVDDGEAMRTRTRLEQLPVAHLLPGHGRPVHHHTSVWEHQRR
jgi:glyoxylase-like metal-dependent hydrolase (beta-lactamase superfamily II)